MNFRPAEDTSFHMKYSLNCLGRALDLSTPAVMGILNFTPDSFFDGGKWNEVKAALNQAEKMLAEGAAIIDIGGQSTRPGAEFLDAETEWKRIAPSLQSICKAFPEAIISVDTFHSSVASRAVDSGARMINDISGGSLDAEMFATIARLKVPYVLMHMQGTPATMQKNPSYENVVSELIDFFSEKIAALKLLGAENIILDPGFGFGKTVEHNYSLLKTLNAFQLFKKPVLAGLSRKSMVTKVLNVKPEEALNGTSALNVIALLNGASILRVHDVIQARQVITLLNTYSNV